MEKLAAVSVDLDELDCYLQIHGLAASNAHVDSSQARHPVYDIAIDRFAEFFISEHIPATFFVIGRSLERAANEVKIRDLYESGFEIGNHTYHHHYDFTRKSRDQIRVDIAEASRRIRDVTSQEPVGFRAPGYTITDDVFQILQDLHFVYDSSVFPCPLYYSAKASAIGMYRLRGRTSHSIIDKPPVLTAPSQPYRTATPYWKRGSGILELPIGVTSTLTGRMPFIGTMLNMLGPTRARWLTAAMKSHAFVNLELHGLDLLSSQEDNLAELEAHQPDIKHSVARKLQTFKAVVDVLKADGYHFVTLAQAATVYA